MKENFIHVCFVIDESGSMTLSQSDVIGGFKRVIDEQRAVKDGTCSVSLFKFSDKVTEVYRGKDVNDVDYLDGETYKPGGMTAMNDGIGTAIDNIGKWLDDMKEDDKPEKNLFVIMTDGMENNSKEYSGKKVRDMIKHQEEKYNWTFMYLGTDITDAKAAVDLGISYRGYSSRDDVTANYLSVSTVVTAYRSTSGSCETKATAMASTLDSEMNTMNSAYEKKIGKKIENNQ
jgi:uncharacterized protein YegL